MRQIRETILRLMSSLRAYVRVFLKWTCFAVIVGIAGGLVGTAFHYAVDFVTEFRTVHGWMLYLLPLAGVIIVFLYHRAGLKLDPGTNLILRACRTDEKVPIVLAPLIFIATTLTHACGGSAGREGAALQLGGSIGSNLGLLARLKDSDNHICTRCGMSAVFSALFGTPITAAVFCMEVIRVGHMGYAAIVPCVISALVACGIAGACGVPPTAFDLSFVPKLQIIPSLQVMAVAILCVLCSFLFIFCMHKSGELYTRYLKNPYIRVIVGAVLVVAISLLEGSRDYNGAGMDIITRAISGRTVPWAFAMKILLTALTLNAGMKGGEIVPTFFIGSTLGCLVAPLFGLDACFGAAIGLICLFCSCTNCPLASVILSVELFGSDGLPLFALGCGICYLLSSYSSLYSSQLFAESKLKDEPLEGAFRAPAEKKPDSSEHSA